MDVSFTEEELVKMNKQLFDNILQQKKVWKRWAALDFGRDTR